MTTQRPDYGPGAAVPSISLAVSGKHCATCSCAYEPLSLKPGQLVTMTGIPGQPTLTYRVQDDGTWMKLDA